MGRSVADSAELQSRVRAIRLERGISRHGLAEGAGLTRQAISAIEAGHYVPNTAVGLRLARVLGCRVEDLFVLTETVQARALELVSRPAAGASRVVVANVRGRWGGHPIVAEREIQP